MELIVYLFIIMKFKLLIKELVFIHSLLHVFYASVCNCVGNEDVEARGLHQVSATVAIIYSFIKAGPIAEPGSHHSARPVE